MRNALLAATILAAFPALAQTVITPAGGMLTDSNSNKWAISPTGSITENGQWVPGGGGTSSLMIGGSGQVLGEDSHGRGWFVLSGDGQSWALTQAPTDATTGAIALSPVTTAANVQNYVGACVAGIPNSPASSGGFGTMDGTIYTPDGQPFVARGINVSADQLASVAATLPKQFRGLNFIRVPVYSYADASTYTAAVNQLTAAGIVVEFENHQNFNADGSSAGNAGGGQGVVLTGSLLATESAWYASIAKTFADNPYVWFGTNNEPSESLTQGGSMNPAALSAWQQATYQAIRGAGNNSPIMLEVNGWADMSSFGQGYTPSVYAKMANVIGDMHYYNWVTGSSGDQSTVSNFLIGAIATTQKIQTADGSLPVIIGEYGNSTTGMAIDDPSGQVTTAVTSSGIGSAAWWYAQGNPGDGLLSGDGLSAFGQQVAGYIAKSGAAGCAVSAVPTQTVASTTETAPPLALTPAASTAPALSLNALTVEQVAAKAAAGP